MAIMLETLEPVNQAPAAPNDQGRPATEGVLEAPRGSGPPDRAAAIDDGSACGPSALAEDGCVPVTPWSSDWLQLGHELRTPLNAMLGNVELLLDGSAGPLAAPVRACVGDIQIASRQLLRQLQPLLLLVQARTAGPVASGPPIDLLALVRQAAAASVPAPQGSSAPAAGGMARRYGPPRLPEDACMMAGDPVWLGALAAALVDLHAAAPQVEGPLSIVLEQPVPAPREEPGKGAGDRPGSGDAGLVMRASWPGLEPAAVGPLSLALIDAVLALHGGRIRSLSAEGLRLDLPAAVAVRRRSSPASRR
jgi:His Kinase A (phospho-acceptor) domain